MVDPALLHGTSHVAALFASLIFALDHGTLGILFTSLGAAWDAHCERADLAIDCFDAPILEPQPLQPIHANDVRPHVLLSIFSKRDWLHETVDLWAKDTLDFSALLLWIGKQISASCTVPASFRDRAEQLAAIARLMTSYKAEVADDDLIIVIVFVVKADIAHYILIDLVLVKTNLFIRISWVDLVAICLRSLIFIDLHGLRFLLFRGSFCQFSHGSLSQTNRPKLAFLGILG